MDPVITTAVASSAATVFMENVLLHGGAWLIERFKDHSPAIRQKADVNKENFLRHLSKRVEYLEAEISAINDTDIATRLNSNFSDPGACLLLQKTLISASSTESDDRHSLLADLILQRMTSGPDDMIALVGNAACDVVCSLSVKHFRILAVLTTVWKLRPEPNKAFNDEPDDEIFKTWWKLRLENIINCKDRISQLDIEHLCALSCCTKTIGSYNLREGIKLSFGENRIIHKPDTLKEFEWWLWLESNWKGKLEHIGLTSIGSLVGTLYHDQVIGTKTHIRW